MNKIIDDLFEQSKEYAQLCEETQYDKGIFISTSDFYKKVNEKFAELIDNPYADHTLSIMHDLFLLAKLGAAPRLSGFLRIRQQNSCFPFLEPMWKERLFFLTRDQGHDCLLYCKKRYGSLKKLNIDTSNQVVRVFVLFSSSLGIGFSLYWFRG